MAVLSLLIIAAMAYSAVVGLLTIKTKLGVSSNKPFAPVTAPELIDIGPPLWHVALGHIAALLSTVLWLLRWPSVTEVWMAMCLVPLLVVPFPIILNNMLEWVMYLVLGNAQGVGSHANRVQGAPPLRWGSGTLFDDLWDAASSLVQTVNSWLQLMWDEEAWNRNPDKVVNCNHSLLCYLQNESWKEMHHLDPEDLRAFPTDDPNSRANAVMMARCATMSYDRWHNIDQAVTFRWNVKLMEDKELSTRPQKYSLLKAWSFYSVKEASELESPPLPPDIPTAPNTSTPQGLDPRGAAPGSIDHTVCWVLGALSAVYRVVSGIVKSLLQVTISRLTRLQHTVTEFKGTVKEIAVDTWRLVRRLAGAGKPGGQDSLRDPYESTSVNTDAFLMKAVTESKSGDKVVALVLAFRGTEALQTVDWISDLAQVAPHPEALNHEYFPLGFTHQGFRDSLGLKRGLEPADDLPGFYSSYLVYEPNRTHDTQPADWHMGKVTPGASKEQHGPYTVITEEINKVIKAEMGSNTTVKLFVTGHSLGGALAHLYSGALLLQPGHKSPAAAAECFEAVYTFGEPRVGDQTWVSLTEQELRKVNETKGVMAEDRFKRVVNTLDIVTRIPPPLGEIYQHPGHCTFIKPHFAIARPAVTEGEGLPAADSSYSPTANLIETPDIFMGTTVLTVLLKLALSVLLLLSAAFQTPAWCAAAVIAIASFLCFPVSFVALAVATSTVIVVLATTAVAGAFIFVFTPDIFKAILKPMLKELWVLCLMLAKSLKQGVDERPRLTCNPMYLITRLLAFLGPAPIVLLVDVLLLPVFAVFTPILWWTAFTEPVLLGALFVFMPPCIISGLVDHSMAEYYTACWLTTDADWKTVQL